jgi:hypothetical protein
LRKEAQFALAKARTFEVQIKWLPRVIEASANNCVANYSEDAAKTAIATDGSAFG